MKNCMLLALAGLMLVTPSLICQTNVTASSPIPEEARKHFVMGETMFKEAKAPGDFVQAENEFKQATDLAPQWPDARYNLALAKEAAGDYSGAMADLKLYQRFKLSDTEARTVQDKIYAIEAKQKMAVDAANSPAAQLEKLVQSLDGGVWRCVSSVYDIPSGLFPSMPRGTIGRDGQHSVDTAVGYTYIAVSGHTISGYMLARARTDGVIGLVRDVPYDPSAKPKWTATLTSRTLNPRPIESSNYYSEDSHEVTISDDGKSITEKIAGSIQNAPFTETMTYVRYR